jgi:hypothetical protein
MRWHEDDERARKMVMREGGDEGIASSQWMAFACLNGRRVPEHAACQTGFAVRAPTMQYALFNVGYRKYLYCTIASLHGGLLTVT